MSETGVGYELSEKSLRRLDGVKPSLANVVKRAIQISEIDFTVIEGIRTIERQRYLLSKGATRTLKSKHLTGDAVDIAPIVDGKVSWDWKYYPLIEKAMKMAAHDLGVSIEWGGDWKSFKDGPHFQLATI